MLEVKLYSINEKQYLSSVSGHPQELLMKILQITSHLFSLDIEQRLLNCRLNTAL